MRVVVKAEGENMYARSNQGISDPSLVVEFVMLDSFLPLLLTFLIYSHFREFATSASKPAELGYASGNSVSVPQT